MKKNNLTNFFATSNRNKIKTSLFQKALLVLFGFVLFLILLEVTLRFTGFLVSFNQNKNILNFGSKREYRILALGESTTANVFLGQSAWPEELEKKLNSKSKNQKFKVFNGGLGGTNTAYILARLNNNLDIYNPDMVITMMGVNDWELVFRYEKNLNSKIRLWLEDIRVYKLGKFLFEAFYNKYYHRENKIIIVLKIIIVQQS